MGVLAVGLRREEPNEVLEGGRDILAVEGLPTEDFFLRENHPFFCGTSSSLTTIRSSVKSGSCYVNIIKL